MAANRRRVKYAGLIKKEVSFIIDQKLKNPEKGFVTVNSVKVSPDLKIATIYFTVLGDEEQVAKSSQVLKKSARYIRNELKGSIKSRFLPELRFFYDDTLEVAQKINILLNKLHDGAASQK